jgi:Txe/YoeB family toxin of toxin-antitoxin system
MYTIIYSSQAQKDAKKAGKSGIKNNILKLIKILQNNPYQSPPAFEKLLGDLSGTYSRLTEPEKKRKYIYQKFD